MIQRSLHLTRIYLAENPKRLLNADVPDYLKEEIAVRQSSAATASQWPKLDNAQTPPKFSSYVRWKFVPQAWISTGFVGFADNDDSKR